MAKLNQGIGVLSYLRPSTSLNILNIVYYSFIESHLSYGAQLWGKTNADIINKIQVLQKES